MPEYWTRGDMARALKVHPATALRWTAREDFPAPAFQTAHVKAWDAEQVREWRRGVVRRRREQRAF